MITFPKKVNNFPQIVTIHPQLVKIFPRIYFHPRICKFTQFVYCRESHFCTFWRQIHQYAKFGGRGRGVKPNLAMPRFWERLFWQYIPKGSLAFTDRMKFLRFSDFFWKFKSKHDSWGYLGTGVRWEIFRWLSYIGLLMLHEVPNVTESPEYLPAYPCP